MMKEKGKDAPGAWWQGWTSFGGDEDFRPGILYSMLGRLLLLT